MENTNHSIVKSFVILGFPGTPQFQTLFFALILATYLLTVVANLVIISVVKTSHHLHRPMYYFLGSFSFLEIWYTSSTVPKMLENFLCGRSTITVAGCVAQLYLFFALGSTECFLLTTMAYDRYLAICHPLHYPALMNVQVCTQLVGAAWVGGFLAPLLPILLIAQLSFCGPKIDHFFCDAGPLLRVSCSDTSLSASLISVLASFVILSTCLLTMVSYAHIITTILSIPSATGRRKAFSTCASHLIIVVVYYGTGIIMYVRPMSSFTTKLEKVVSVFCAVVTPLLNPLIYSLRNKEVKEALRQTVSNSKVFLKSLTTFVMVCW